MSHNWRPIKFVGTGLAVGALALWGLGAAVSSANHHAPARVADSGKVIFSDDQAIDTLNPFQAGTVMDVENTALTQPIGNNLIVKASGTLQAEEITTPVDVNSNHLTWTFSVKSGQQWSNGDDLTGYDYLLYWHLAMDPTFGPVCAGFCDDITSIDLSGPEGDNVTLHLDHAAVTTVQNVIGAVGFLDTGWSPHRGGLTNADFINCLNATAPLFPECDTLGNELVLDPNLDYLAPVTGANNDYVTAGPWQVTGSSAQEVDYTANPNYNNNMPGGAPSLNHMEFLQYTSITAMENGAGANQTDITQDYTLADVPTLQSYPNFNTYVAGVSGPQGNPEILTFNTGDKTIPSIDGDGSMPLNGCKVGTGSGAHFTCIKNPFYKGGGKNLRDALALSFDRAGILQYAYNQSAGDAQQETSYCAPILCPNSGAYPPMADAAIPGQWDPFISAYVTPRCAASNPSAPAVLDAEQLIESTKAPNGQLYSNSNPLVMDVSSTTLSFRHLEMDYLNSCWSALTDGGSGQLVHVHAENRVPSSTYFAAFASNGTLAVGHFEGDIHAYGGVSPEPQGWQFNLLSNLCERTNPSGGNFDCIDVGAIDNGFNLANSTFPEYCPDGTTVVTCATAGGNTHPYLGADKRWKQFNAITTQMNKNAFWTLLAPRPNVFTYDGTHPANGFQMNGWAAQASWNAFSWS